MNSSICPKCGGPYGECGCGYYKAPCDKTPVPPKPPFIPPTPNPCKPCGPVVPGMSLYEVVCETNKRFDIMSATYNDVMKRNYATLDNLLKIGYENGAFYSPDEVKTEQGYFADESSTYTIVRKCVVDNCDQPIRVKLAVAYGNTTNSGITQDIFEAGRIRAADKIASAIKPITVDGTTYNGWYGHAMLNGSPIKSEAASLLYTMGFTKSGRMKVYSNTIDSKQLIRDGVVDAMGCNNILVNGGEITSASYRQYIPNATVKSSRVVIGQNYEDKSVYILSVGNENTNGMTSQSAAQIMISYGCDVAVELTQGIDCGLLDKGISTFVFDESGTDGPKVPVNTAFWYISKKSNFTNRLQWEISQLSYSWGETLSKNENFEWRLSDIDSRLKQEILDRLAADAELQSQITTNLEKLNKEIDDRIAEVARLDGLINSLKDDINSIQSTIDIINTTISSIQSDITSIKTQIQAINIQLIVLDNKFENYYTKEEVNDLIADIQAGEIIFQYRGVIYTPPSSFFDFLAAEQDLQDNRITALEGKLGLNYYARSFTVLTTAWNNDAGVYRTTISLPISGVDLSDDNVNGFVFTDSTSTYEQNQAWGPCMITNTQEGSFDIITVLQPTVQLNMSAKIVKYGG